jgi:hypothetical protein
MITSVDPKLYQTCHYPSPNTLEFETEGFVFLAQVWSGNVHFNGARKREGHLNFIPQIHWETGSYRPEYVEGMTKAFESLEVQQWVNSNVKTWVTSARADYLSRERDKLRVQASEIDHELTRILLESCRLEG